MAQKVLHRWPLVVIAIDKLGKATGLVVVSFLLQRLLSPEQHERFVAWIDMVRLEPKSWFMRYCLEQLGRVAGIQPGTLKWLHVAALIYAGLYLVEGVGLIFDKKWAEWMVVITTAMFLPLEVYEIIKEITWPRCLLFAANLGMALYLLWRLRWRAALARETMKQDQEMRK
jgi:uncharacterized membrane protein (DUF2068 family)